ncbi:hypothetical protein LCGC14_0351360 [marine sediment metagenome]|uniref:Uncharacterized protein n=1 Tax=marine sediment metagenome TaxID=412755 RepID=A0A0F9TTM2_9ZZZZ
MPITMIQPATQLIDENGTPYGVKHVGNKPRVSAMPYTFDIAEGNVPNHTAVNKFGQNVTVGATLEDVWDYSAAYEYLADDTFATMYISSDDELSDVGLTFSVTGIDSDYNYSTVTGTLHAVDARTMVAITSGAADNKWWRIFRIINTSGTPVSGNIYVSKDNTDAGGNGIPDDTDDIQAQAIIGNDQTLMALWSCPVGNTAFLTHFFASTSSNKVTSVELFVRPFGGVFNVKAALSINQGHMIHQYDFPVVISAKSDVKIMASAVGGGGIVSAGFDLWFET